MFYDFFYETPLLGLYLKVASCTRSEQPAGGAALEQDSREQGEKAALVQGSTILEDMEEVGAVALEGAGAGEDRTEGGNDFCYPYHRYYLETYSMIYI